MVLYMIVFASKKQKVNKQSTTLCTIDTTYVGKKNTRFSFNILYVFTFSSFIWINDSTVRLMEINMRIRSMDFYNTNRCVVISYESSTSKHIIVETDEQVSFTYIHVYCIFVAWTAARKS